MDAAINGSYAAYCYLTLLQVSLVYVQRPDLTRRTALPFWASTRPNDLIESYFLFARLLGSALSWASWMFAVLVGSRWGILSGLLFFVLGFGTNMLAMLVIPRWPRFDVIAHVISLPTTAYLLYSIVKAAGREINI